MKTGTLQRSATDIIERSVELVRNVKILHSSLPDGPLIEEILKAGDEDYWKDLDRLLRIRHFLDLLRKLRIEERNKSAAQGLLFPELRDWALKIPAKISIGKGATIPREALTYKHLQQRLKFINARARNRQKNGREANALRALMKIWPARTGKNRNLTLAELDRRKAQRAGLLE